MRGVLAVPARRAERFSGRFYLDGQAVMARPKNAAAVDNALPFRWGAGWNGALDELAIYDKALDPARVKAHFDAAQPSK
jgi:hypothetical protein